MVPVLSLLIPIAVSAVFVFIASSIIHMATPSGISTTSRSSRMRTA